MEIEIRREALAAMAAAIALAVFTLLGYFVSPRASDGRPVLLLPDVRAIEDYRRQVASWSEAWRALDTELRAILDSANTNAELLTTSRAAQQAFEQSVALAGEVASVDAPAPLVGLREQVAAASAAYTGASLACARWLSAPSVENQSAARLALADAALALTTLETNEWLVIGTPAR